MDCGRLCQDLGAWAAGLGPAVWPGGNSDLTDSDSESGPGRGLARRTALYLCAAVNICILSCPFSFPPFPLPPPSFLGQGPSQPEIRISARPSRRPPARAMICCMPGAGAATPPNRSPRETWPPPPLPPAAYGLRRVFRPAAPLLVSLSRVPLEPGGQPACQPSAAPRR